MNRTNDVAIVYLHGFPGGPEEISLFGSAPDWSSRAFVPDRSADRLDLAAPAYFDDLTARVERYASERAVHLIGFSLGARAAMEIAARMTGRVARIDLISPAGPLDGTDHLDLMAGRIVFSLAATHPRIFGCLAGLQAWVARQRPDLLYAALFRRVDDPDLADDGVRHRVITLLQTSFSRGAGGYSREVLAYVTPWSDFPRRVEAATVIWQGTQDSWTPLPMAERLETLLPNADLRLVPEKTHYGTLRHALTQLKIEQCATAGAQTA